MLRYKLYINDVLRAIKAIEDSVKSKTWSYFEKDVDVAEATAMRLQIIGESIKKIPLKLRKKHEEVEWENLIRFRNIISHAYFKIDKKMLWNFIKDEIPKIKKVMEEMANE